MTEAEWLAQTDKPEPMLSYLGRPQKAKRLGAIRRRLRLFACACARRLWPLLEGEPLACQRVELAEKVGEGLLGKKALAVMPLENRESNRPENQTAQEIAGRILHYICWPDPLFAANFSARIALQALERTNPERGKEASAEQVAFLRDLFGNPFRPVTIDPAWLSRNTGIVRKLAQTVYDDRAFERLPILADALEEASCTDAAILTHCRGPGPHVRGCWVIDLLLGNQ